VLQERGNSLHRLDNAWRGQVPISHDGMDSYVRNGVDGGRHIRPVGRGMDPHVQSLTTLFIKYFDGVEAHVKKIGPPPVLR